MNTELEKIKSYIHPLFKEKFPTIDFETAWQEYNNLKCFNIAENVEVIGGISEYAHFIMLKTTQYHIDKALRAMKIDMTDSNVNGEEGTAYRLAKMYCGKNIYDNSELLSGRWMTKPNITTFPNENKHNHPITKRVDIVSVCSHHIAPFSTLFNPDAYAIISYIPNDFILGISKLQRVVDWIARRGHLQENLTKQIHDEIKKISNSSSVYVELHGIIHTCENIRGVQSHEGSFSSIYYSGLFENTEYRNQIK